MICHAIPLRYSEGQICRLEQNQRLPDLPTLAARFVPALDLENEPELVAQLLGLAAAARHADVGKAGEPPAHHPQTPPTAHQGNLPTPLTPLINRSREVAAIRACLARDDVHLLTLVGPPGIGKTRLGLYVAGAWQARFRDGVYFVALAPIRDPAQVLPAIAHTLGIKKTGEPALDALRTLLSDRQVLLVLDNFEQVADAAPHVAELLRAARQSKALVTSRAALHLSAGSPANIAQHNRLELRSAARARARAAAMVVRVRGRMHAGCGHRSFEFKVQSSAPSTAAAVQSAKCKVQRSAPSITELFTLRHCSNLLYRFALFGVRKHGLRTPEV